MSRREGFRFTTPKEDVVGGFEDYRHQRRQTKRLSYFGIKDYKHEFNTEYKTEYQLMRGEAKFPRTTIMVASEMFKRNREFEYQFVAKLDRGEKSTLWSWRNQAGSGVMDTLRRYIAMRRDGFSKDAAFKFLEEAKNA